MKLFSEKKALEKLKTLKSNFTFQIITAYEHRAKSCLTCETPGACCLDEHFVNVHISRLEAVAIRRAIADMPIRQRTTLNDKIAESINKYSLNADGDTFAQTYSCPLFQKGTGCLVHHAGKPTPCIAHACYEKPGDLPPDELQTEQEVQIDRLNHQTYGRAMPMLPIPLALRNTRS